MEENLYLVSIAKDKNPSFQGQNVSNIFFFLFLPLFALYLLSECDLFNMSCLS